ncbi:MAG TPA: hypothetical protein VM779_01485 [Thermoanaerobaculia bacterium]|nr:hypothetical protein [Thermoanaerobaculia bacterium]
MRLDRDEMLLFEAACADPGNLPAQELLNVFGAETAARVLESMPGVPLGLFADLVSHIWQAIAEAKERQAFRARFLARAANDH